MILMVYMFFMFYSIVNEFMTQWQKFSVFSQQEAHVEIRIEYLVATSYELWMM